MDIVPHRVFLVSQTQDILRQGITGGHWRHFLPGERKLSRELHVSRWTLRTALAGLAAENRISISQGKACKIISRGKTARSKKWRVGFILPEPLPKLRGSVALWIDELRASLQDLGGGLDLYDGPRLYQRRCAAALSRLTSQSPHDCWILLLSNEPMQRWFHEQNVPAIVAGSVFEGLPLPSLDRDHEAIGQHAAGVFLSRGHRRIAFISSHRGYAGIIECERGFRKALDQPRYQDAQPAVVFHSGEPVDLCKQLDRLFAGANPPTALFVQQSNALLTTLGYLAQKKLSVPDAVSVIVGEEEPFLRFLVPQPAHYSTSSGAYAQVAARLVQRRLDGTLSPSTKVRLVPQFVKSQSIRAL